MKKPMTLEQKNENKIRFINAALELMQYQALGDISIRKIAETAGFHNSTIYLYFNDLFELFSIASVKYFQSYAAELSVLKQNDYNPYDYFIKVWETFCDSAFNNADIFYQFFFGKYSDDLTSSINAYYDLFPEEKNEMSQNLEEMFYGTNIADRCKTIMLPLKDTPYSRINDANIDTANMIIVGCLKVIMRDLAKSKDLDVDLCIKKFIESIEFIVKKTPPHNVTELILE